MSIDHSTLGPLSDWFDCPQLPSRRTELLPRPGQVIEPPQADHGEC